MRDQRGGRAHQRRGGKDQGMITQSESHRELCNRTRKHALPRSQRSHDGITDGARTPWCGASPPPSAARREPRADRMMGVVDLDHEIGDGELQLVRPQPPRLVARRQVQLRPEIEQNVRGLRDDELAGLEDRGADAGRALRRSSMIFIIAARPDLPLRATST